MASGSGDWSWTEENETIHIHVVMHVLTFTHKCFRKNPPTSGRGERWEDGEAGEGQGVIYRPISSSEHASCVAFSLSHVRQSEKGKKMFRLRRAFFRAWSSFP